MSLTNLGAPSLPSNAASPEIVVNTNDNLLDAAMNSHIAINFSSDADLTLSTTGNYPQQWQYGVIELTDTGVVLTAGRNVIVPNNERVYRIVNNTAQTLTVKTSSGTGISLLTATGGLLYCDGTNVEDAIPGSGGGLTAVAQDTTPQLGGDLDVNGNGIVSVSAGDIPITPDTTGSIILDGLSWPQADGTVGQVLQTNGAGQLSFVTGGATDGNAVHVNVAGEINGLTSVTPAAGDVFIIEDASDSFNKKKISYSDITGGAGSVTESLIIPCSDESTALTTGTAKITFRMPYAFTVTAVRASLTVAGSTSGTTTVDINEGGTSILSTKLTINAGELTSTTAATAPVISDSALADDAEITIDVDAITTGATEAGLKVTLIGTQA